MLKNFLVIREGTIKAMIKKKKKRSLKSQCRLYRPFYVRGMICNLITYESLNVLITLYLYLALLLYLYLLYYKREA